jgi:large subunit ribosomal protein L22
MAVAETTDEKVLVRAKATYVRTSARKARVVLAHVRGKRYADARAYLRFATQAVARDILGVLESAGANAENNLEIDRDDLVVEACYADEGPTAKRWRPRARGRASRIRKRTCHVTVVLAYAPAAEETREDSRQSAAEATIEASRKRRPGSRAKAPKADETTAAATEEPPVEEAPEVEAEAEVEEAPEAEAVVEEAPEAEVEEAPEVEAEAETAEPEAVADEEPAEGDDAGEDTTDGKDA